MSLRDATLYVNQGTLEKAEYVLTQLDENEFIDGELLKCRILNYRGKYKESLKIAQHLWNSSLTHISPLKKIAILTRLIEALIFNGKINMCKELIRNADKIISENSYETLKEIWIGRYYRSKGKYNFKVGDYESSTIQFELSLHVFDFTHSKPDLANTITQIAMLLSSKGQLEKSLKYHKKSLDIRKKIGNNYDIVCSLNNIGIIYCKKGDINGSLKFFQECISIIDSLDVSAELSKVLNNLANVHQSLGNFDLAMHYYDRGLNIARINENTLDISLLLLNIGNLHLKKGKLSKAFHVYNESLDLSFNTANQSLQASLLSNIGAIYQRKGEFEVAIDYYKRSLEIRKINEDKSSMVILLYNLGSINFSKGEINDALKYINEGLKINKSLKNKLWEAKYQTTLAKINLIKGETILATKNYTQALQYWEKISNNQEIAIILQNLSYIKKLIGDYESSLNLIKRSYKLRKQINNPLEISETLFYLISLLIEMDQIENAQAYFIELQEINNKIDNKIVNLRFTLAEAIIIRADRNFNKMIEAQKLIEKIIQEDYVDFNLSIIALLYYAEYLLIILKGTNEENALEELLKLVDKLYEIVNKQNNIPLLIEIMLIEIKIAVIENNFQLAEIMLENAIQIAENHNLSYYIIKITYLELLVSGNKTKILSLSDKLNEIEYALSHSKQLTKEINYLDGVIHDIKNLLANSLLFSQYIQKELDTSPIIKEYATHVERSNSEIQDLLQNLLEFKKLEISKAEIQFYPINLYKLVQERVKLFEPSSMQKNLRFILSKNTDKTVVQANKTLLSRILDNLISNAIKFSPKNGSINIEITKDEESILFIITNDGEKIPKEYHQLIFQKFARIDKLHPNVNRGIGMGLAFSKSAIESMDGSIDVISPIEGEDYGVQFILKLQKITNNIINI